MKNRNYTQKSSGSGQKRNGGGRSGSFLSGKSPGKFAKPAKRGLASSRRGEGRFDAKPAFEERKSSIGDKRRRPQRDSLRPDFEEKKPSFGDKRRKSPQASSRQDFEEKKPSFGNKRRRPQGDSSRPSFEDKKPSFGDKRRRPQRESSRPEKFQPREKPFFKKEEKISTLPSRKGIYLWGFHAVREAWLNEGRHCYRLIGTSAAQTQFLTSFHEGRKKVSDRPNFELMERDAIDSLLPHGAVHQGLVLEVDPLPDLLLFEILQAETLSETIVVLDQVTDPHNIGAVLRSAAAFGAGAVIVTEKNAPETTGVMAKAASGALEHVPLVRVVNLSRAIQELQQAGYWCVGLAEEGKNDLSALKLSGKTAIVLGAEGDGLRRLTRESCDELVKLPTMPPIGSLNVSNAAAVALYEVRRQRIAAG